MRALLLAAGAVLLAASAAEAEEPPQRFGRTLSEWLAEAEKGEGKWTRLEAISAAEQFGDEALMPLAETLRRVISAGARRPVELAPDEVPLATAKLLARALSHYGPAALPAALEACAADEEEREELRLARSPYVAQAMAVFLVWPDISTALPGELAKGLGHKNRGVREICAGALPALLEARRDSRPASLPAYGKELKGYLNAQEPFARLAAARSLLALDPACAEAARTLGELAESGRTEHRVAALAALSNLGAGATPHLPAVLKGLELQGRDEYGLEELSQALGRIGPPAAAAAPFLCGLAEREVSPRVKAQALLALARLGIQDQPAQVLYQQTAMGKEPQAAAAARAAQALLAPERRKAAGELFGMLVEAKDDSADEYLLEALADRPGESLAEVRAALQQDARARTAALKVLARLRWDDAELEAKVAACLQDRDEDVKFEALAALAEKGSVSAETVKQAAELLAAPNLLLRQRAAATLGEFGAAGAEGLARACRDPQYLVWAPAFGALSSLGPNAASAAPALAELTRHEELDRRVLALMILSDLGAAGKVARPALEALRRDPERLIRILSSAALVRMEAPAGAEDGK